MTTQDKLVEALRAHAAEAAQAQAQSGGWVMVPRKITQEMEDAADRRDDDEPLSDWGKMRDAPRQAIWDAMLAAAPQQAAEPVAWRVSNYPQGPFDFCSRKPIGWPVMEPLYTHPQPAQDAKDLKGAAERLCRIYFEIAAKAIGEDEVRRLRDAAIAKMSGR